jgi:hypothetical protein
MELVLKGRRAFRPYRLRTQRYAVLVAHRRCGKTVACVQGLIDRSTTTNPATWPLRLRGALPGAGQRSSVGISQAIARQPTPPPQREKVPVAAVQGSSVCRMHGAAGGAPRGNRNALKHGDFTAKGLALKKQINTLARLARKTMSAIELGNPG